jgi:alpha-amylase/alpha-mannosidase (GH57 family)
MSPVDRYVCIHGHFYQPPRENPWLESVELQEGAYPYHDWNERINAECYAPNGASRMLDAGDRIVRIVNNYSWISFDFGPTLLAWLKDYAAETYTQVLQADRDSARHFGGHGSALAQHYNHMIMPLANARDKRTQTIWGLRDFEHRFGRAVEGMWLPETAVDLESLDLMAELGVRFTVLAPNQASAVRRIGAADWRPLEGSRIDTTRAYVQKLPSGRTIAIFFYDGPTSRAVAFEGLLRNGERFAQRLLALHGARASGLAHIATDGETYGHHHRHGDMALAYALHHIENGGVARLTNYADYLDRHPPADEVRVTESTSWSCAHGVERWRADCGCHTGGQPGWNQRWREPLRTALDWLRDTLAPEYQRTAAELFRDPWAARDDYIDVILDRGAASRDAFFARHASRPLELAERVRAFKLLELQRHAMLMYTSCGWFFNDLSGIETVQVLRYAGRAVQLAHELFGNTIEDEFLHQLARAHSNVPEMGDGRRIYETQVRPAMVDLLRAVAHYAVDSLLADEQHDRIYSYTVEVQHQERRQSSDAKLFVGRAKITSEITQEIDVVTFAVLHFGSHNLTGGIRRFRGDVDYTELSTELVTAFEVADTTRVVNLLARFPEYTFSLKSLFSDRQREIIGRLLHSSVADAETAYRGIYERDASLMRFLIDLGLPIPRAFLLAAEYVINLELHRAFEAERLDMDRARTLRDEATSLELQLDGEGLAFTVQNTLERLALEFRADPSNVETLDKLAQLAATAKSLPFDIDLWRVQNLYYEMVQQLYPAWNDRAREGDASAELWVALFTTVGEQLAVAVA